MQEGYPIVKAAATLLSSAYVPSRIRFRSLITCALVVSLTTTCFVGATARASAQSGGSAGTIEGAVTDPSNAAVSGASAEIENSVTGYKRQTTTDEAGTFRFDNVPQNNYELTISAKGFATARQTVSVRSTVPISLKVPLLVAGATASITVQGTADVVENVPSAHTDVAENLINRLPLSSPGSGLNEVIAAASPNVVRDSNGFFHPLGDHAQTTYVIDNQAISDQRSKAFSTQLPVDAIQSLEVITGAPPAWVGDKSSLIVNTTTKSGLDLKRPAGSFRSTYGTFGTFQEEATFGIGGHKIGNFTAFDFERSGRFLDAPEFVVIHDRGNSSGLFDRLDYNPTSTDALHLNIFLSRNNFQVPNQFDQDAIGQDQHQLVRTASIAAGWVHTFNPSTLLTISPYYRLEEVRYFPSANPFSDQTQTIDQQRRLTNAGITADLAYNKGRHNIRAGVQASHTFLTEAFQFGLTDPGFNDPASPNFLPGLLPFDLTRGGHLFSFHGHTDIKQEAFYAQDSIAIRNLNLVLGLRFDNYNGIVHDNAAQPRVGASYLIKKTGTVLRGSYSRTFETPYNENLILSSATGAGGLADTGVLDTSTSAQPLRPGRRNQYNAGLQQGFGKYIVIDGDYFWKYTRNAYDFNAILSTPITFPISWSKSKLDGVGVRASLNNYRGLSVYFTAGHTRARYFPPETGGLFFNSNLPGGVFRIDHDQAFQQTTNVVYQFNQLRKLQPYVTFTWKYDSGLVSGSVADFATALTFSPDMQAQIGLFCGSTFATPQQGLTDCTDPNRGALRVRIPADGTANDDHNPPRVTPRHLFDASVGTDNLFRTEHTRITLRLFGANLANKIALYNFNSTFSGTHFVTPRTLSAQLGVIF
jgi:hypothetical protein